MHHCVKVVQIRKKNYSWICSWSYHDSATLLTSYLLMIWYLDQDILFTWVKPSYNRHSIVAKTQGRKTGEHQAFVRDQQRLTSQVSVDPEAGTRRIEHAHASLTQFQPDGRYQELFLFTLVYAMLRKPLVPIGEDELCSIFSLIVSCHFSPALLSDKIAWDRKQTKINPLSLVFWKGIN